MNEDTIAKDLIREWGFRGLMMRNVFVLGSPWECDVIEIRKTGFWVEYEIKTSVADFRRDVNKVSYGRSKRDVYMGITTGNERSGRSLPCPKEFYYVTPVGLLTLDQIPDHAGWIEVGEMSNGRRTWMGTKIVKRAPRLKGATKIDYECLYNIAAKVAWRSRSK